MGIELVSLSVEGITEERSVIQVILVTLIFTSMVVADPKTVLIETKNVGGRGGDYGARGGGGGGGGGGGKWKPFVPPSVPGWDYGWKPPAPPTWGPATTTTTTTTTTTIKTTTKPAPGPVWGSKTTPKG